MKKIDEIKDLSNEEWIEQELARLDREDKEEEIRQELGRIKKKKETEIDQKIERLEWLIRKEKDDFDDEQWKRTKRTFFVLCGVILLYLIFKSDISISEISGDINLSAVWGLLGALVLVVLGVAFAAGFIMFVSYGVWFYVMHSAMESTRKIAKLEGELNALRFSKYDKD